MESDDAPALFLTTVSEVLVPVLVGFTLPVFAQYADESLELLGSGVVIEAATRRYFLTASHLINQVGNARLAIGVGTRICEVSGTRWRLTTTDAESGTERDKADVTVIRLEGDALARNSEFEVIPLSHVEFDRDPDIRNPLLLCGFPCTKHKKALRQQTFHTKPYSVIVDEIELGEYAQLMIDRTIHLCLGLDRKDVWNREGRRTAPSLHGMSGSGVWRTSVYGSKQDSSLRLAGIFSEHYQQSKTKHVVATRLAPVLGVVARTDANFRAALADIGVRVA
jgi:hypothetical protein